MEFLRTYWNLERQPEDNQERANNRTINEDLQARMDNIRARQEQVRVAQQHWARERERRATVRAAGRSSPAIIALPLSGKSDTKPRAESDSGALDVDSAASPSVGVANGSGLSDVGVEDIEWPTRSSVSHTISSTSSNNTSGKSDPVDTDVVVDSSLGEDLVFMTSPSSPSFSPVSGSSSDTANPSKAPGAHSYQGQFSTINRPVPGSSSSSSSSSSSGGTSNNNHHMTSSSSTTVSDITKSEVDGPITMDQWSDERVSSANENGGGYIGQ